MIDTRLDDGFKTSADTALQCLYIAVDRSIADDVNVRVGRYIEKLEEAARGKGELIEALEEMLEIVLDNAFIKSFDLLKAQRQIKEAQALLNRLKESNVNQDAR